METHQIKRIITEEMNEIDFLNDHARKKEERLLNIVNDKDFQIKFIRCLIQKKGPIKYISSVQSKHYVDTYDNIEKLIKAFEIVYTHNGVDVPVIINIVLETNETSKNVDLEFISKNSGEIDFDWVTKNVSLEKNLINSLLG